MAQQTITFDQWLQQVVAVANASIDADVTPYKLEDIITQAESWKDAYEGGTSPAEAWQDECAAAGDGSV